MFDRFDVLKNIVAMMLLSMATSASCFAQGIPESTLKALKDGTALIRLKQGSNSWTGSGFLIEKHRRSVEVVFNSGTKDRKSFTGQVVSEDRSRDLAVLKIKNKDLPDPIELVSTNKIRETVPVYILGFPFGDALSAGSRGPSITIGRGTISSIRRDDFDELEEVQVDGDINPGNSGGPIVFTDGSLMGVSVSTVIGTNIGLGIPGESVLGMLNGRVGELSVRALDKQPKSITAKFEARLIDPLGKMKDVSVLYIDKRKVKNPQQGANGRWTQISDAMKEVKLTIEEQKAIGQETLEGKFGQKLNFLQQVKFTNGSGETFFTAPAPMTLQLANKPEKKSRRDPKGKAWIGEDIVQGKIVDQGGGKFDADGNPITEGNGNSDVVGEPTTPKRSLGAKAFKSGDAKCQHLSIDGTSTVANLVWSREYDSFYSVSNRGVVRKISFPGLIEEVRVNLGAKCTWMELTSVGLAVLVEGTQNLVLLDENTFEEKDKFPIGIAKKFAASRDAPYVYMEPQQYILAVANLRTGKPVKRYNFGTFNKMRVSSHPKSAGRLSNFELAKVTPDGKYLIAESSASLHRFRIRRGALTYEQISECIASNPKRVEISDDSNYVAVPSGGGNGKGYTTYVYLVTDLHKRAIEIEGGAYPHALAFDKEAGLIYSHDSDIELKTFSAGGLLKKKYNLSRERGGTRQFLVHPDGHKLLVLYEKLTLVELPK